jgi:hypothetical protein
MPKKKKTTKKKTTKKKTTTKKSKATKKTSKAAVKKSKAKKASKKKTSKAKKSKKSTSSSKSNKIKSSKKSSTKKKNYSEIDKSFLDLVNLNQKILLLDLKEELNLSTDEVKKALLRLESKGKITYRLVMTNGKWLNEVRHINYYGEDPAKRKKGAPKLVWDTVNDCPCFICPSIKNCETRQEYMNPESCDHLSLWISSQIDDIAYVNPFKVNFDKKKKK